MNLPKWDMTPREEIRHELNDLAGVVALLRHHKVLSEPAYKRQPRRIPKIAKVESLMAYAERQGSLVSS